MTRIGIFSGTFDPVHNGHIDFAKAVVRSGEVDKVIFLPEAWPRNKSNVTPIEQRLTMLKLATADEPSLEVRSLPDRQFTVTKTLPELQKMFAGDELFLLMGADVAKRIDSWPGVDNLRPVKIIIGERKGEKAPTILPLDFLVISGDNGHIAASGVRSGMAEHTPAVVQEYIKLHKLYNYNDDKN